MLFGTYEIFFFLYGRLYAFEVASDEDLKEVVSMKVGYISVMPEYL